MWEESRDSLSAVKRSVIVPWTRWRHNEPLTTCGWRMIPRLIFMRYDDAKSCSDHEASFEWLWVLHSI
jgi:hypothetical protein